MQVASEGRCNHVKGLLPDDKVKGHVKFSLEANLDLYPLGLPSAYINVKREQLDVQYG